MDFIFQKNIQDFDPDNGKRYYLDFYLPKYNLALEYNGKQHYEPRCFGGISQGAAEVNFEKKIEMNTLENFVNKIKSL